MKFKSWLTLLTSLGIILLASSVGGTMASFLDQESSSGNTFQAWTSTLWRQTNQTDFEAGDLNSVDITSSPGDVKLAAKSDWYSTDWSRRKPVTINNEGSNLTDYQVKVNVTYDSDMQSDFDDIRFTDADGLTELSHWRESYTDSDSAIFWVKVPSIPSGSKTIYMYYGNSAASSASNGSATFIFFDDFEDGSQDWTVVSGSWSESNGVLSGAKGTSELARVKRSFSDPGNNYAYEWKQRHYPLVGENDAACAGLQIKSPTTDYSPYDQGYACYSYPEGGYPKGTYSNWVRIFKATGGYLTRIGEASVTIEQNKWYHYKITYNGGTIKFYVDETEKISVSDTTYTTGEVIRFHAQQRNNTDRTADFDDIRIRKYAEPEPTTSVGSEEGMYVSSGTIASQVLDTGANGAKWDCLSWDEIVEADITNITFEVRANDSPFAKNNATLSWTPVGGISPVTSGLPPGQYKQWRATLTTSDNTKTPVLHEVRVYYY